MRPSSVATQMKGDSSSAREPWTFESCATAVAKSAVKSERYPISSALTSTAVTIGRPPYTFITRVIQ